MRSAWMILVVGGLPACALPEQHADFDSPDPTERALALGHIAEECDATTIAGLIELLDSEDPAERMLAIRALEKQTGQTLGYEHAASERDRREAIQRWVAWQRGDAAAPDPPTPPAPSG